MSATPQAPTRLSTIAGSLGAVLIILSAPAHSLIGWPEIQSELARVNASADLVLGLQVGWHFGGAAMVGLGLIVLHLFYQRARGSAASRVPASTVAALYLLFGLAALVVSGLDPFFLVFIVPGALVLVGVLT